MASTAMLPGLSALCTAVLSACGCCLGGRLPVLPVVRRGLALARDFPPPRCPAFAGRLRSAEQVQPTLTLHQFQSSTLAVYPVGCNPPTFSAAVLLALSGFRGLPGLLNAGLGSLNVLAGTPWLFGRTSLTPLTVDYYRD